MRKATPHASSCCTALSELTYSSVAAKSNAKVPTRSIQWPGVMDSDCHHVTGCFLIGRPSMAATPTLLRRHSKWRAKDFWPFYAPALHWLMKPSTSNSPSQTKEKPFANDRIQIPTRSPCSFLSLNWPKLKPIHFPMDGTCINNEKGSYYSDRLGRGTGNFRATR